LDLHKGHLCLKSVLESQTVSDPIPKQGAKNQNGQECCDSCLVTVECRANKRGRYKTKDNEEDKAKPLDSTGLSIKLGGELSDNLGIIFDHFLLQHCGGVPAAASTGYRRQ
jgi:hypothetical protein